MKSENIILVPTDFTKVAENAANHAVTIAQKIGGEVHLLHVVAKPNEIEGAKKQLAKAASQVSAQGIEAKTIARVGNIFEDIGDVASEIGAKLIIMGTHGIKGIQQRLTGSYALKVITSSSVPFIVVQEKSAKHGYKDIVLPLDLSKDTKHKLSVTVNLAKYFDSKIHVFAPKEDDEFLKKTVTLNLNFTKKYLSEKKIPYEAKVAEEKGNFVKQIMRYATTIEADLIAIVNSEKSGFDFLAGGDEQQVLTNEAQIPVLCVNPAQVTKAGGILGS